MKVETSLRKPTPAAYSSSSGAQSEKLSMIVHRKILRKFRMDVYFRQSKKTRLKNRENLLLLHSGNPTPFVSSYVSYSLLGHIH